MAKTFRDWDVNQGWLLPPSVHELVPSNHLSHFVRDTVRVDLDLSAILDAYQEERGYGRMLAAEKELEAEVKRWMERAEAEDEREDREYGPDRRGDELPDWVKNKAERAKRIREARQALEEEAKEHKGSDGGSGTPAAKAQRNFTDPDSRIMKTKDGFEQAYNCQIAVDHAHQVIVAAELSAGQSDSIELPAILKQIKSNTGEQAKELSADAGYCSEANLKELNKRRIRGFIATGRQKHGQSTATNDRCKSARVRAMKARLRQGGWRSRYRLRKQTVEPVFGQIKEAMGFRRFLLRGREKVREEWRLVCAAFDLRKLAAAMG